MDVPEYSKEQIRAVTIHALMEIVTSASANPQSVASAARTLAEINGMVGKNSQAPTSQGLEDMSLTDLDAKILAIEES